MKRDIRCRFHETAVFVAREKKEKKNFVLSVPFLLGLENVNSKTYRHGDLRPN